VRNLKIFKSLDEINNIEPCALALGNFDGVHKGHQELIHRAVRAAKRHGIKCAVFTFSNHPRNMIPGQKPVENIIYNEEKAILLEELGVDYLFDIPFTKDVMTMEKVRGYRGTYHVLGGALSPLDNITHEDLTVKELIARVEEGGVKEVIIAISTSVEGETTLFYLMSRLKAFPDVKVTTIARGIGFGDELEYVDELTITHALLNRREV
jgi:hypothetical protein